MIDVYVQQHQDKAEVTKKNLEKQLYCCCGFFSMLSLKNSN